MTTKTEEQMAAQQEADLIIQQLAAQALPADEIGSVGEVIARTVEDEPLPMRVSAQSSAGYAYVWHTATAQRRRVNRNMLPNQLKKKLDNGKPAFTVFPPTNPASPVYGMTVKLGSLLCMLHAKTDQREYYDTLGLPVCVKSTLPSVFQVQRHMQTKHSEEWKTLESMRELKERSEDRTLQQSQTDAFMTLAGQGRAPVAPASEMPVTTYIGRDSDGNATGVETGEPFDVKIEGKGHGSGHGRKKPKKPRGGLPVSLPCVVSECEAVIEGKNKVGAISRMGKHMREEHV